MTKHHSFSFKGLGTVWGIHILQELPGQQQKILRTDIVTLAREFEDNYSRFKDTSYIGQLNSSKTLNDTPLELRAMLEFALEIYAITEGYFTIAAGTRLEDAGYDKRYSFKKRKHYRAIRPLHEIITINGSTTSLEADASIDLGGFGKGWLIDKIGAWLIEQRYTNFIIDGGGDILVSTKNKNGVSFPLDNPLQDNQTIGEITVMNGAIASSSPKFRSWPDISSGSKLHHLINPKSNSVITDIAGVYTHAPTATAADTASTCIFVSPPNLYKQITRHFGASFCIVYADGTYFASSDYPGNLHTKS